MGELDAMDQHGLSRMRLHLATFLISWVFVITQVAAVPLPSIISLEASDSTPPYVSSRMLLVGWDDDLGQQTSSPR